MRPHYTDAWDEKHAWPDRRIAELAARQATTITTHQLRQLGIAQRTITAAGRRGRLHRVHHGVYSLVLPRARPPLAPEWAALHACGPTALLSHHTAAWLHELLEARPWGDVSVTVVSADRRRSGIEIHRVVELDRTERARRGGLPLTSVARTLLDLAPTTNQIALERLLDRALRRTSPAQVRAVLDGHPGRPGGGRLRALLDLDRPSADTWSRAEDRLLAILRRADVPMPEANVPLGPYTPDLLWRRQQVIVEYDSNAHHSGPAANRWDTVRHNHFTARHYLVIHVTWEELSTRPERVLAQIVAALTRAER